MTNIQAIIFDWGRTLYDNDLRQLDPAVKEVLAYCSKKYQLAIVSITTPERIPRRQRVMRDEDLDKYFSFVKFVSEDKDAAYEEVKIKLDVEYPEIAIVDDRTIRGIKWGNQHGRPTICLQKGKFAQELPNAETGQPTYKIHSLKEVMEVF